MFLYEKLQEIGKQADLNNNDSIISTLQTMIKECFAYIEKERDSLGNFGNNLQTIRTIFQKTDSHWRMATKQLEKDGIPLADADGFKNLVKSKEAFKEIFT